MNVSTAYQWDKKGDKIFYTKYLHMKCLRNKKLDYLIMLLEESITIVLTSKMLVLIEKNNNEVSVHIKNNYRE